jgi:putative two-component system response regulator
VDTGRHIERVQSFARALAEHMSKLGLYLAQMTSAFIETIYETASLHDIGKVAIPDAILLKPGKLTAEEFATMQRHSAYGSETLAAVLKRYPDNQFLRMGVDVARSHHEKWDGSGYPDGLTGATIPLAARIVAVADYYDALTSNRCYRSALSHEVAAQMIHENSGSHFDPGVVQAFGTVGAQFQQIRSAMQDA